MKDLPKVSGIEVMGKRVLVRADLDVPMVEGEGGWMVSDDNRLRLILPTLRMLLEKGGRAVVVGHLGRPGKGEDERRKFSLVPVGQKLGELLGKGLAYSFAPSLEVVGEVATGAMVLVENLRFEDGEGLEATEGSRQKLVEKLAGLAEVYVNESFAESHPQVASTVGAPQLMRERGKVAVVGLRFAQEVATLGKILEEPRRPLVVVVGGAKLESKLPVISKMEKFADRVLVGGRLPGEIAAEKLEFSDKVVVAQLAGSGRDIEEGSLVRFESEIGLAGTIVWGGPMGVFEEEGEERGTRRVAEAIVGSGAFKVAGGGDTEEAIRRFGLSDRFDWISIGGGAMLEFLASGTLPAITALLG